MSHVFFFLGDLVVDFLGGVGLDGLDGFFVGCFINTPGKLFVRVFMTLELPDGFSPY